MSGGLKLLPNLLWDGIMTRSDSKSARNPRTEFGKAAEKLSQPAPGVPTVHPGQSEIAFTEAGSATVAALLHLLRLLAAELVLFHWRCDVARLEQAVHSKIGQFTSPTTNQQAREAGRAYAQYLVDKVLTQIRAQAELYPVHVMTRKSFGLMTRKLSVTESQRSAQFRGTVSRRKPSVASANWAHVA